MQELEPKGAQMTSRSVVTAWCVVLGLTGVLPSAGTGMVALVARQVAGSLDDAAIERAIGAVRAGCRRWS